ncbi:peptidase inhibitor family I36 protein [Streptomyces sp. IBSBF 3136]|uniref:peptidase inhibitor family I36 protein n=1 Tax=Streptomyces sp. IBSBF 3136 TaxID=2903524 RepID=UPI002FDBF5BA
MRHLPDYIRGKGSSFIDNSGRTARIYQKDNYFGRHVCVRPRGRHHQRPALLPAQRHHPQPPQP